MAARIASETHCRLQSYRGENMYAFLPEKSGKIQAILKLAGMLDISLDNIAAFGDDISDIEIFALKVNSIHSNNKQKKQSNKNRADSFYICLIFLIILILYI